MVHATPWKVAKVKFRVKVVEKGKLKLYFDTLCPFFPVILSAPGLKTSH